MDAEKIAEALNAVEWFTLDGKLGFKGPVGGTPRQIVGGRMDDLFKLLVQMANGIEGPVMSHWPDKEALATYPGREIFNDGTARAAVVDGDRNPYRIDAVDGFGGIIGMSGADKDGLFQSLWLLEQRAGLHAVGSIAHAMVAIVMEPDPEPSVPAVAA